MELSDEHETVHLQLAIDEFRRQFPNAVQLCNVLEHFDDYLLGIGWSKAASNGPTFFHERGDCLLIHVADMVIDVEAAETASINLATVAIAGGTVQDEDHNQS